MTSLLTPYSDQQRRLNARLWAFIMTEIADGTDWADVRLVLESASNWAEGNVHFFGSAVALEAAE